MLRKRAPCTLNDDKKPSPLPLKQQSFIFISTDPQKRKKQPGDEDSAQTCLSCGRQSQELRTTCSSSALFSILLLSDEAQRRFSHI